jgi:FtsP/CotA-like multicopper oxidase with cupredoxin domain
MRRVLTAALMLALVRSSAAQKPAGSAAREERVVAERILPNDNRVAAGTLHHDTLTLHLVARQGRWFPQADSGPSVNMQAFAEEGHAVQVPGPLLRVRSGTRVRLLVRNELGSALVLFGMHEHPGAPTETVRIPAGASRELSFRAGAPGTYFYWASTTGNGMRERDGIDSQLYGAFVIDSAVAHPPPRDRIFVIGVLHESAPPSAMVINGKSWPFTERLSHTVGDTVRWRWINPSGQPHPMHLHGFYFNVDSRGAWAADTVYAPRDRRLAATEMMMPGGTMSMTWIPERAGNWLFHCHFSFHVSHYLSLTDPPPEKDPDSPETVNHSAAGMAGLVLGIAVRDRPGASPTLAGTAASHAIAPRNIRLFMQASPAFTPPRDSVLVHNYAFVAQQGDTPPARDSVPARSSPLVLRRGEPVRITIENRLPYPGAVHWHGIEVQNSYVDGVPGWSGSAAHLAPMVMPGDSFVAEFTPPRAGTFIYHSHANEYFQISAGLAAPLIVLEPGAVYDTLTDRTIFINEGVDSRGRINGASAPDTMHLVVGTEYRFRLIDIAPDWRVFVTLVDAAGPTRWRALAKDGADLPSHQRRLQAARVPMAPGETADFVFTPTAAGDLILDVSTQTDGWTIRVPVLVRNRPVNR